MSSNYETRLLSVGTPYGGKIWQVLNVTKCQKSPFLDNGRFQISDDGYNLDDPLIWRFSPKISELPHKKSAPKLYHYTVLGCRAISHPVQDKDD